MSDPSENPTPTRQIQWTRFVIEGVVIVASILMAFGIEAWWDERQDRGEEQELLADLIEEFQTNRTELARITEEHGSRDALFATLIREAGPDRLGISSDSLRTLAEELFLTPTLSIETGVLARAQSGNGLALISDPDLRASVAGFWDRYEDYFGDQMMVLRQLVTPATLLKARSRGRRPFDDPRASVAFAAEPGPTLSPWPLNPSPA